ncbi:MAG TPA: DUF2848 domain-containing protein [Paenalcaligenes hominis]|uniref:DUF2848 domain-containing protein n=1 Tax=Paenalcaligenes hominis TaxID=643674 RepID=A0A9D3A9C1_9BURK|nr:DUF2848 domain-containing protein [Paenalcaligenes hominis]NJB65504.1 hypothetical protein [Paenalcaligenes hominis]GGE65328.1 hypothetical protein GCM10007278_11940 [Paenalcaligenes hominis]HJH22953.1 DUF2848 domain-containing protein [Paenalcaligenes hominis]
MLLNFDLVGADGSNESIQVSVDHCIVAGWAGRDRDAIEHHILELAELGVPRPSDVPLYYRIATNQLVQSSRVQVVGPHSSGEAEVLVFNHNNELCVSLASDHTDRALEAHSVALSKQICVKPTAQQAWRYSDVAAHWDELILRAWILEEGQEVAYQDGAVATLLHPIDLIKKHFGQDHLPNQTAMTCGTVATIGSIRPAAQFTMELYDPRLERSIRHTYDIEFLPEIA